MALKTAGSKIQKKRERILEEIDFYWFRPHGPFLSNHFIFFASYSLCKCKICTINNKRSYDFLANKYHIMPYICLFFFRLCPSCIFIGLRTRRAKNFNVMFEFMSIKTVVSSVPLELNGNHFRRRGRKLYCVHEKNKTRAIIIEYDEAQAFMLRRAQPVYRQRRYGFHFFVLLRHSFSV